MTAVNVASRELLGEEIPHAIHHEGDYRKDVARVEILMDKRSRSAAENRYVELLSILIDRYEEEHDPIAPPIPLDALKALRSAKGMPQSALAKLLGSSGIASEVLSGQRSLSKTHVKKLSEAFNISTELFV